MCEVFDLRKFEESVASGKPMMVDFGAEWCGPCKAMEPVIRELAKEYEGRIVVGSCDVEENNALAVRFSIRNVPTVLFLKNGEVVDSLCGIGSENDTRRKVGKIIVIILQ